MSLQYIYPTALKLVGEARADLGQLEAGPTGERVAATQRQLDELGQHVDHMVSLVRQLPPAKRGMWRSRIAGVRNDHDTLSSVLAQCVSRVRRNDIAQKQRSALFAGAGGGVNAAPGLQVRGAHALAEEGGALHRSNAMADSLLQQGRNTLDALNGQRTMLKGAQRKVLDIANILGLSSALMRVIERRESGDKVIVYGCMTMTLLLMVCAFAYASR